VKPTDTALFVYNAAEGNYSLGQNTNQSSSQNYVYQDSLGNCYSRTLTVSGNVLNTVKDGAACKGFHF
jgi:hypothetical protein